MAQVRSFEELDFFSDDDEDDIDFSHYLSDIEETDEDVDLQLEKADVVEIPEDFDIPRDADKNNKDVDLFDSLLGEALSGEEEIEMHSNPRVEGLFDDLSDSDSDPELVPRHGLEDLDSGISSAPSVSQDSLKSSEISSTSSSSNESFGAFDMSTIEKFLEYMKEEEHAVSVDDIPDFASKKNVYGTSFNVRTGAISRPPRFEFARRDARWIDSFQKITYDNSMSLKEMLAMKRKLVSVKLGAKLDLGGMKHTTVHQRNWMEMESMETHDIQEIIKNAFNEQKLAVILFGVKEGIVKGCKMTANQQDNLRLALDTAIQTEFVPPVENVLDAIDIQFVPLENVDSTFLVVIRVKQLRKQNYRLASEIEASEVF